MATSVKVKLDDDLKNPIQQLAKKQYGQACKYWHTSRRQDVLFKIGI